MFNPRIERLERVLEGVIKVPAPNASDKDKVPMVNADGDYELEDLPKEVPEPAVADEGKIIGVNSSGKYALVDVPNNSYVVDLASDNITITPDETTGIFFFSGNVSEQVESDLPTMLSSGKACMIHTGEMYYDENEGSYVIDDSVDVYFMITGVDGAGNYLTPMYYYNNQNSKASTTGFWMIGYYGNNTSPVNPINA